MTRLMLQDTLKWTAKFAWHALVVTWRVTRGRWYVFHDRPDWFVWEYASIPTCQCGRSNCGDYRKALVAQAHEEARTRVARREREADRGLALSTEEEVSK